MADQSHANEAGIRSDFESRNTKRLLSQFKSNPKAFEAVASLIKDPVISPAAPITDKTYVIELLTGLVKEYDVPIVIMMVEPPEFCNFLDSCFAMKKNKEVSSILEACLQAVPCSGQKDIIPNIYNLYKKLNKSDPPLPTIRSQSSDFFNLFEKIQKVLKSYKKCPPNENEKKLVRRMIREVLEERDYNNSSFTNLQKKLFKGYRHQLSTILKTMEAERDEQAQKKKMKANLKATLENLPVDKQLKNRTSFIEGENLLYEEGQEVEYKDYTFPFTEKLEKTLKRTICAFLNRTGGRIYIGVTDDKIVKGVELSDSKKAELIHTINKYMSVFEPDILDSNLLKVYFLPVIHKQTKEIIPNLFIVKLVIQQGDPTSLYSVRKDKLECYLRYQDQTKSLSAKEIKQLIIERHALPSKAKFEPITDPEPSLPSDTKDDSRLTGAKSQNTTSNSWLSNLSDDQSTCILAKSAKDLSNLIDTRDTTRGEESKTSFDYSHDRSIQSRDQNSLHFDNFLNDSILNESLKDETNSHQKKTHRSRAQTGDKKLLDVSEISDLQKSELDSTAISSKENNSSLHNKSKRSSKLNTTTEGKKNNPKQEGKEYFSHLLTVIKNDKDCFEVFVQGLPITWTLEDFDNFIEKLGKDFEIHSSRMFKKDTGLCNGKAFVNFISKTQAEQFINRFNNSTEFGQQITAKFK